MDLIHDSGRLYDSGRVVIFWHITYPQGISDEADNYYKSSATAFEESCRGDLYRLALEYRRSGGRGVWRADYICDCGEVYPNTNSASDGSCISDGKSASDSKFVSESSFAADVKSNASKPTVYKSSVGRHIGVQLKIRVTRGRECLVSQDFIEIWRCDVTIR